MMMMIIISGVRWASEDGQVISWCCGWQLSVSLEKSRWQAWLWVYLRTWSPFPYLLYGLLLLVSSYFRLGDYLPPKTWEGKVIIVQWVVSAGNCSGTQEQRKAFKEKGLCPNKHVESLRCHRTMLLLLQHLWKLLQSTSMNFLLLVH